MILTLYLNDIRMDLENTLGVQQWFNPIQVWENKVKFWSLLNRHEQE